ncbi:MAG: hypothetical protein INH41_19165 [Myxococcaceae bacterium]|jgi:hypothetical protein|nr:hypothetical protein [Myxococcaceae bacterium]MCA3014507.1 hypothetical protein [Myxococcaceae bacterium]
MNPIDPVEAPPSSEDRVGTVERMMEQSRALDAEAAAARAARVQTPGAPLETRTGFERGNRTAAQARIAGAPTPEARQAQADAAARARELDRLNQPGNRPITAGVRERTDTLRTARATLDEQNRLVREGVERLGPTASDELRNRFRDSFQSDPAYQQAVERERAAAQDLSQYLRTNAGALLAEYPSRPDAPAGSEGGPVRAHGGNVAYHALATLAGSSDAGSAIELSGRLNRDGLLPDNRLREVVTVAVPNDYLNRVRNGERPDAARDATFEGLRGFLHGTSLARDLDRTQNFGREWAGGPQATQGGFRGALSGLNAVHSVIKAVEGANAGRAQEAAQDGLKSLADAAEATRDILNRVGFGEGFADRLGRSLDRGVLRAAGVAAGGIGVVNNLSDFMQSGDWRYAAAAVGEVAQGLAAVHPASRFLRMAGAAGSAVATVGRAAGQENDAAARLSRHLGHALGDPRAAEVFARNPRAIEVMRQAGLSEADIIRRAGDPNARFLRHPADLDQLRDLLRRERARR